MFFDRNTCMSTDVACRLARRLLTISPALENSISEETEVAGIPKFFSVRCTSQWYLAPLFYLKSGERCELYSPGVPGGAPTAQRFSTIFSLTMASPDTILLSVVDYHSAIWEQDQPIQILTEGIRTPNIYSLVCAPLMCVTCFFYSITLGLF